jgi:hypothetical protein
MYGAFSTHEYKVLAGNFGRKGSVERKDEHGEFYKIGGGTMDWIESICHRIRSSDRLLDCYQCD